MNKSNVSNHAVSSAFELAEAFCLRPKHASSIDSAHIASQVEAQLAAPLEFPPLAQATIPGDRVVLAVAAGLPQQPAILDGVLRSLRSIETEASLTTILISGSSEQGEMLEAELAAWGHTEYRVMVHDGGHEKEMSLLGVSDQGEAIRLNRKLCDADFVLPIFTTRGHHRPAKDSAMALGLYPTFSDRETIERFSRANAARFPQITAEGHAEIENCHRQLGILMTLEVVPNCGGQVAAIFAGDPATVAQRAQEKYRAIWRVNSPTRGNLVVAALAGCAQQQTWHDLGHALAAAETVVEPGGAIVLATELNEPPDLALSQLIGDDDFDLIEREILRTPAQHNGTALRLCRCLQQGPIFLRSNLPSAVVESLGMTPWESPEELERLAQTQRPCLVLEEAEKLLPVFSAQRSRDKA